MGRFLLVFLLLSLPALVEAELCEKELGTEESLVVLRKTEEAYKGVKDLTARFKQVSYFLGLDQSSSSTGDLSFLSPGMMDWNYQFPEEQRFVADGKLLWFYQPSLMQVTVSSFADSFSSDLPVSFLLGLGRLSDSFEVDRACEVEMGYMLELLPTNSDSMQSFRLVLNSDYFPRSAKTIDIAGNETTISLEALRVNQGLDKNRFTFEIPKGLDVIDNRLQ